MKIIDSPFLWSGKKTKLLPQLLELFPDKCDIFIDLFGGSGSVIANTNYKKSIFNDLYMGNVIKAIYENDYVYIIKHCTNRIKEFNLTKENKEEYYNFKNCILNNKNYDNDYYLDIFCISLFAFNGRLEFNKKGDITNAFGKRNRFESIKQCLLEFKDGLDDSNIMNNGIVSYDYKYIIDNLKVDSADIFIYCDVPYSITRINGYKSNFNDKELFEKLDYLDSLNVKWGLSNVFEHKGKKNEKLIEWSKKYNTKHLDFGYENNNNSSTKEKEKTIKNITDEVYICNY